MTVERWQYPQWLAMHRGDFAENPVGALIRYVRALNSVALDELSTTGPNALYDEAEDALEKVIEDDGATPARVHHLVMTLINDAQANAFSDGPGWPDLGRALDAAQRALDWHNEFMSHLQAATQTATDAAIGHVRSGGISALLTLARVQGACALLNEAQATFAVALKEFQASGLDEEWHDVVCSVGHEVGADPDSYGGEIHEHDRTAAWYWYAPV